MAGKNGTYLLKPQAEADLEANWLYTVENWSVQQADKYYGDFVSAFHELASGQAIGRPVDIREGYFKIAVGSHFIFYQMTGPTYDIIRILHQRQDVNRHL